MERVGKMRIKVTGFCVFGLFVQGVTFGAEVQQMPKQYQNVLTTLGKLGDYKDNVLKKSTFRGTTSR